MSPAAARAGQQVTASYTLSNTGNIELRGIAVTNPTFSDRTLTAASLSVGERILLTDTVTMGEAEIVSEPRITYHSADSDKELAVDDLGRRTITVAENGLTAQLTSDNAQNVYPGTAVDVKLSLKNTGDTAIDNITATLPDGTQIVSLSQLAAGGSYEAAASYVPTGDGAVSATVTGVMPTGETVTLQTGEVAITMQDLATALMLNVTARAETQTMYSEPAIVRFQIDVENVGETDAATLTISEAGVTVGTIPSLPSGESRSYGFDAKLSMAGQVQFAVSGKDALGDERTYYSDIIRMAYVAPTPTPTAAPTPTPVPPTPSPVQTATPEPTLMERLSETIDLQLAGIIAAPAGGLIALLLIVRAIRSAGRRKRLASAVDTMPLESDVRDSYGRRRRRGKTPRRPNNKEPGQIVSTTELTEEETAPHPETAAAETDESHRRRGTAVPEGRTLRVTTPEKRPEEPRPQPDTTSETRIYGRAGKEAEAVPLEETRRITPAARTAMQAEAAAGATVRLEKAAPQAEAVAETPEDEPRPKPKRGLRGLFARKPAADDVIEDEGDEDEDLYE